MIPERLSGEVIYESRWVSLHADRVRTMSGRVIERMHVVRVAQPGVALILEDAAGSVAMVRVPRYATGLSEWELPQGRGESAEERPEVCAEREGVEETGWSSSGHEVIHTFFPVPGLSDHVMHVVRARAVAHVGDFDRDEIEDVRWFPLDEIRAIVRERRVQDGFTLLALFLHLQDRVRSGGSAASTNTSGADEGRGPTPQWGVGQRDG